eukprot:gene29809-biopygen5549
METELGKRGLLKLSKVFIDDILVHSATFAEHIKDVEAVLQCLIDIGLRTHPDKSCFALDAVDFLGFDVSNHGLTPQAAKVQAIKDLPYPNNLKDLKTILGAVLGQLDSEGNEYLVACASRSLNKHEAGYNSFKGEMLDACWACKIFRVYVFGLHFTLVTDHQPLLWMFSSANVTGAIARWACMLQSFDFDIMHRPGAQHGNADALSRFPSPTAEDNTGARIDLDSDLYAAFPTVPTTPYVPLDLTLGHIVDYILDVRSVLSICTTPLPAAVTYMAQNGITLYIRDVRGNVCGGMCAMASKLTAPSPPLAPGRQLDTDLRLAVMSKETDGLDIHSDQFVLEFLRRGVLGSNWTTSRTRRVLARGNTMLMHAVEYISAALVVVPIPAKEAIHTVYAHSHGVLANFGAYALCISDNGPEFQGKFKEHLLHNFIDHMTIHPNHPQGNGFVERSVGTIKAALTKICSENLATDTWDIDIAKVVTEYNCSPQETTKCAPFTLLYARAPVMNNPEAQLAMTAPLPNLTDSTQVQALTDTLLERAQWIKRVSPTIANHIEIAHHRDTLRYAKIRGGAYHPRLRKFQVGDFVYIRRPNVRNSLQMAAQGMIMRIIDLKPTEVVFLQGRCVPVEDWFCPNCKASGITAIPAGRIPEAPQKEPNLFPTPQTRSRDFCNCWCRTQS